MKLKPYSPDELLVKAYQCQADADAINEIIGHLKSMGSELMTGFGGIDEQLEFERLEATVAHLKASTEYLQYIANLLHQLVTPIGPGSRIEDLAAAFKD